ncbi:MAG: FAD-dependent oxidoreductase [Mycetocola sp.]
MSDDYDVVVAGSGAAGLVAALSAAVAGARVLVAEAAPLFGGATSVSGGQVWVPGHHHRGTVTEAARQDVRAYCTEHSIGRPVSKIDAFLDAGPAMARFVEEHTPLRFTAMGGPDSLTPPEATEGWNLEPAPLGAGQFADWQEWVWSPPYPAVLTNDEVAESRMIFGGAPPGELIERRMSRGEVTLGVGLVIGLLRGCIDAGVGLIRSARLSTIETENGRAAGVVLDADGTEHRLRVRGGVILATGGFEHDRELVENLLTIPTTVPASPPVAAGDGLRLAAQAGASLAHLSEAWYWPVVPTDQTWGESSTKRAEIMLAERALPHTIWVNTAGRRFVNEASHNCAWALASGASDGQPGEPAGVRDRRFSIPGPLPTGRCRPRRAVARRRGGCGHPHRSGRPDQSRPCRAD